MCNCAVRWRYEITIALTALTLLVSMMAMMVMISVAPMEQVVNASVALATTGIASGAVLGAVWWTRENGEHPMPAGQHGAPEMIGQPDDFPIDQILGAQV